MEDGFPDWPDGFAQVIHFAFVSVDVGENLLGRVVQDVVFDLFYLFPESFDNKQVVVILLHARPMAGVDKSLKHQGVQPEALTDFTD